MKKFSLKKRTLSVVLASVAVITLVVAIQTRVWNREFAALGQDAGAPPAGAPAGDATTTPASGKCRDYMRSFLSPKRKELAQFITTHFQSGESASTLLPDALTMYRLYRTDAYATVEGFFIITPGSVPEFHSIDRESCYTFVNDELYVIRETLKSHVVANAKAKRDTALVDKYKEINDKLSKLNFQMAQFQGYLGAFDAAVPCVLEKCVQK
ncbi:MAG: hypothetical protein AAB592_03550 [Patescibacteria group bacterium]